MGSENIVKLPILPEYLFLTSYDVDLTIFSQKIPVGAFMFVNGQRNDCLQFSKEKKVSMMYDKDKKIKTLKNPKNGLEMNRATGLPVREKER